MVTLTEGQIKKIRSSKGPVEITLTKAQRRSIQAAFIANGDMNGVKPPQTIKVSASQIRRGTVSLHGLHIGQAG